MIGHPEIDVPVSDELDRLLEARAEVAIDFTHPDVVMDDIRWCISHAVHAVVGTTGITQEELRTALQDGQSIAEVAQSKGVDPQVVIDAMVAEVKAHLDEEVASGEHTQEEADEFLANATQRITDLVNCELPAGGPGFGRGPRGFGPGAPADDSSADSSTGTSA